MRTKFLDPIPPSHIAWYHFDNAISAYQAAVVHSKTNYHYKRSYNHRYKMRAALRKEGASESLILEWCFSLRQQCLLP